MIRKDDIYMEHNYYLAHHGVKGQKWGGWLEKKKKLCGTLLKGMVIVLKKFTT